MLFKKNNAKPNTASETTENENSEKAVMMRLRRRMRFQIVVMAICLVALCSSSYAFVTQAWYSTNREVTNTDNAITSDVATVSLFISEGTGDVDNLYNLGLVKAWPNTAKLFPISTSTCQTWWYVDTFTPTLNAGGTAYEAKASHFTQASATVTDGVATYNNSLDGNGKVAYVVSEYKLYTDRDSLDVYLDPATPISVSYANADNSRNLLGALRVGIEVGETLKLIYAPTAESGTGNSVGSAADTFYAVDSATSIASATVVTDASGLAAYKASASGDSANPYTAGTTPLGTAVPAGVQVRVYVWLEGTDAQAMLGVSDNDLQGINVTVKYVGVVPAP